jgi:hypothetical protein
MASGHISDLRIGVDKARAWLDEYLRAAQLMERAIRECVISTPETIADSRDLLDRVGSTSRRQLISPITPQL